MSRIKGLGGSNRNFSDEEAERRARDVAQRMLNTPKPKKDANAASEKRAPESGPDRCLPPVSPKVRRRR